MGGAQHESDSSPYRPDRGQRVSRNQTGERRSRNRARVQSRECQRSTASGSQRVMTARSRISTSSTVLSREGSVDKRPSPMTSGHRNPVILNRSVAGRSSDLRTGRRASKGPPAPTSRRFPALASQCLMTAFVSAYRCGAALDLHQVPSCRDHNRLWSTSNGRQHTAGRERCPACSGRSFLSLVLSSANNRATLSITLTARR
ncbi:hypothetical protein PLANPX_0632 [Lacipirellula parvula]|uniref:Uncharacterized protein n=1 Tax=Lacipirellula parvula TaxID=2650471 RepID=A0A5K7X3E2_9BACT|nr:hypothetical protein PLANPX_0632 [Lacipirellula parvula]